MTEQDKKQAKIQRANLITELRHLSPERVISLFVDLTTQLVQDAVYRSLKAARENAKENEPIRRAIAKARAYDDAKA